MMAATKMKSGFFVVIIIIICKIVDNVPTRITHPILNLVSWNTCKFFRVEHYNSIALLTQGLDGGGFFWCHF